MRVAGPAPFVTFRSFLHRGRRVIWRARQHRKGLSALPGAGAAPFWRTPSWNLRTGALFAVGSLIFMLGATLSVVPNPLAAWQVGAVFFAGSIPFTAAGFMQNLQAANAEAFSLDPPDPTVRRRLSAIGWKPGELGWLSTVTQFAGTVAFNFNTFDAIDPPPAWYAQDLTIWVPGMIGSVLFLVSGCLAFFETSHGWWSWRPRDLDWRIVSVNLLGCVFFMTAGVLAYVPRGPEPGWIAVAANAHLWIGALCFLIGAVLMMAESAQSGLDANGEAAA